MAITKYQQIILPLVYFPACCGCIPERCGGRHCRYSGHFQSLEPTSMDGYKFAEILHKLLINHPNTDILRRFRRFYWETPKVEYDDFTTIVENPNGTKTSYHPQTQIITWKKANVRMKVGMDIQQDVWFEEALKLLTGSNHWWNICYAKLEVNIQGLKPDQIDKLAGSMEPTTEPPVAPEPQSQPEPAVSTWSRRSQRLRRRFNHTTYDAIELTGVQPTIHP
jgi:hypothetical protein